MISLEYLHNFVSPWAKLYADSTPLTAVVTVGHLGGMLLAGGLAIGADRATFAVRGRYAQMVQIDLLRTVHAPILAGLGLTTVTGVLMLAADLDALLFSPLFLAKMGIVVALLSNGAWLGRMERGLRLRTLPLESTWKRLKLSSAISLSLWFVALVLGAVLPLI